MNKSHVLLLLMLLVIGNNATTCTKADQLQCTSMLCANYFWYNSTCHQAYGSYQCLSGEMPLSWNTTTPSMQRIQSGCVRCSLLYHTNCSVLCPGYIWASQNGSVAATCMSCQSLFGPNCIRCSASTCLSCAYSSSSTLTPSSTGCVTQSCSVANCVDCYAQGTKCARCRDGYQVDSNFGCATATCTITQCAVCQQGLCGRCNFGYSSSTDKSSCQPVCSDIFCTNCVGPGICGTCTSPYSPNSMNKCQLDCSLITVSNCLTCSSNYECTKCKTGYTLAQNGALCQGTCQITKCQYCPGNISSCVKCTAGYDLYINVTTNTIACTQGLCVIEYCKTCRNVSACAACIDGFTLSSDESNCTTKCPTTYNLANCLFCNSSNCHQCQQNYIMNSGSCVLPCASITNCISCYTSTLCKACAEGYKKAPDHKSCVVICQADGCQSCSSPTASDCNTCKSGYTEYTDSNGLKQCAVNCGEGQVNTGVGGSINCQNCDATISFCATCTYSSATGTVIAETCQQGYFVSGTGCAKCSTAVSNCFKCSNANTCEECDAGYNVAGGLCVSPTVCPSSISNCVACNSTGGCIQCKGGYEASGIFCVRKSCPATYTLDSTDTCICTSGTFQSLSQCKPCSDQRCVNCTINICQTCSKGFYPLGSTCRACIPNCEVCHTGATCQTCSADYSKTNNGRQCEMFSSGGVTGVIGRGGSVIQCQWGCRVCITGAMTAYKTICTVPKPGYSIIAGKIVRCRSPCRTCRAFDRNRCTSCYYRYTNVQGTCVRCSDANALTCSSYDTSYSYTCRSGYVTGYFPAIPSYGGECLACASYCRSCKSAGPGNCDTWGCNYGTIQLVGTTNCTKCFRGCSRCSRNNPTQCTSCRYRLYLDYSTKQCKPCNSVCIYCRNSADYCYSCIRGYRVVNNTCMRVPNNCVRLDNSGTCSACFKGYWLNGTFCSPDISCNGNSSCQVCPYGYYQSGASCQPCTLPTNCVACDQTNITECTMCNKGYYLRSNYNSCYRCPYNCLECDDYDECTVAKDGYYVPENSDGETIGWARPCQSPCATCSGAKDFCKTCKVGYTLNSSSCRQNFYLMITLVLGPGTTGSIILSTQSQAQQLFNALRSLNRIGNAIDVITPSSFKDGRNWRERLRFLGIRIGSLVVESSMDTGDFQGDNNAASATMTNALASGSLDGMTYVSSSIEAVGSTYTEDDSGINIGLILGITIPLVVLITVATILIVRKVCFKTASTEPIESMFEKDYHDHESGETDKKKFVHDVEPTPEVKFEQVPTSVFKHELDIDGGSSDHEEKIEVKPQAPAQYELQIEGSENDGGSSIKVKKEEADEMDFGEYQQEESSSPLKNLKTMNKKSSSFLKVQESPQSPEIRENKKYEFGVADF